MNSVEPSYPKLAEQNLTGVAEIDDDHRVLFELLNRCQRLSAREDLLAEMNLILGELQDYTVYHFRREELIMDACRYPHLKNHQLVHGMLIKRTEGLVAELNRGELKQGKLIDFLRNWLLDHVMTMDKAIAPYCKGREAAIKEALEGDD
ncbi:MAG: hemerythrin family protein [Chromatiales bacterium]|nr:hemerythrin family protein [Chromatiales bacterium]